MSVCMESNFCQVGHPTADGTYPQVAVQVGDEFHRIVRSLLQPLPCGSL